MAYKLEFADQVEPDDKVWESFGVKVLVDEKSLPYLDGTELDYTRGRPAGRLQVPQSQREEPLRLRRVLPDLRAVRAWLR